MRLKSSQTTFDHSAIPLQFMAYLASDEERITRFCSLTGFAEKDLVEGLKEAGFQGFLLDFALQDESLLLAFCAETGLGAQEVVAARRHLPGSTE